MYNIRARVSTARPQSSVIEIAGSNDYIPLKETWLEQWCTLPKNFEKVYERIFNLETRAEDVFLVTFMKAGTTWMQEALWLLMNNLDYKVAKRQHLTNRSAFLDLAGLYDNLPFDVIAECDIMTNRRLIKTHLPANLLPKEVWQKKRKIVYVARNVKDVITSSFNFLKALNAYNSTLDDYIDDFMHNAIAYTPYWEHVIHFWKMRHEPDIFFTTYEEMQRDLKVVLQRLYKFLELPELNEEQLQQLLQHLSFKNMKANQSTNPTEVIKKKYDSSVMQNFNFMRRGIAGSYMDELTEEQQNKLNDWSDNILAKYGIREEDIFVKL